ncbi:MAG: sensor histidine kinase [Solirubrobacteraceae bacterium]
MRWRLSDLLDPDPPPWWAGVGVASLAVALITAVIYPLRDVSAPTSSGVLYLLPVLLVGTIWGLWLGVLTSVTSAAAFNFFHIAPLGRFAILHGRDVVSLVVFFAAAVVASSLADLARTRTNEAVLRRREADLAADMARLLVDADTVQAALGVVAKRLAETLELSWAGIELGEVAGNDVRLALPLRDGDRTFGTLLVEGDPERIGERLREQVVPSLEALLSAALEREALQAEVVETKALRRSDEIKTAVLRSISHDLRTPLTAIVAAGEMLSSPGISAAEHGELAHAVTAEAARLTDLVDKLLDLSRLHAGAAVPRRDWCAIDELLEVALDHLRGGREGFVLSVDRGLPLVRADAVQIERALANLLENAARYSGGHPVSVRARAVGAHLMIRIVDRGPGVAANELERVFEAFYLSPENVTPHTGSGLGLAIVRGFVEANGGRVWAESSYGQGTTFVVELSLDAELGGADHHAGRPLSTR